MPAPRRQLADRFRKNSMLLPATRQLGGGGCIVQDGQRFVFRAWKLPIGHLSPKGVSHCIARDRENEGSYATYGPCFPHSQQSQI